MESLPSKQQLNSDVSFWDTEKLLQLLAEIPVDQEEYGYTALYRVISALHDEAYEAVDFLLKAGADPNRLQGHSQVHTLSLAAGHYCMRVTRLLLENGADPNAGAFHVAAVTRKLDMIQLFLAFGANLSLKSRRGEYPLDIFEEISAHRKQKGGTIQNEAEIRRLLQPN